MKLKATKTLVNFINNEIKNNTKLNKFKNYQITLEKLTLDQMTRAVDIDAQYNFNYDIDFNYKTNTYNVIMINYPLDFYANSKYLTTYDLRKMFRNQNKPITTRDFLDIFLKEIEI